MIFDLVMASWSLVICYVGLTAVTLLRHRVGSKAGRSLTIYLIASAIWSVSLAIGHSAPASSTLALVGRQAAWGGLVILSVILLNLVYTLLEQSSRFTAAWWVLGLVSMALVVVFTPGLLPFDRPRLWVGFTSIGQNEIVGAFNIFAWFGFTAAAALATIRVFRQTTGLAQQNRYRYLLLSFVLVIAGDVTFAANRSPIDLFGALIKLSGALVLTLAVLRYRLVDIKSLYRQAFSYVAITLMAAAVGLVGIWVAIQLVGTQGLDAALIGVGLLAVLVAFGVAPAQKAIQRFVDRKLFHIEIDYETALRSYGERVIGMLKLEPLADLAISTLIATTGARRGALYLMYGGQREIGGTLLRQIKSVGDMPADDFELHPDSALMRSLRNSDEPICQYDIDLGKSIQVNQEERAWIRSLDIEVLVPIHNQDKPVGLIAMGAKRSRESYATSDLAWFRALADQTAVALENARLFGQVEDMSVNVMRLNADLQRAYQQLQEVDRLKSAFIGVISHELRSPFVAASFSVQLLYRYAEKGMLPELQSQIPELDKELSEGRRMIDSVISFASLLSKQGEIHPEKTNLGELIQATLAPLQQMAQARNISVTCAVSPDMPMVEVDAARMGEAIYHLAHNAIKFNHEQGMVRISCWPTEAHVVLKVEDTGAGIPPEKLSNIWEAFTQAADDVKRGVEGVGLGLPLVKFVIEGHGGEVWAASKPGAGSTFGFRIPRQAVEGDTGIVAAAEVGLERTAHLR